MKYGADRPYLWMSDSEDEDDAFMPSTKTTSTSKGKDKTTSSSKGKDKSTSSSKGKEEKTSSSSKKNKSSDASAKPYDSDDDFMPDKHGNLPWKKINK